MLLNSFLHQRGDDCTSQSGKTEKGGRYGFIIKFAFPPSFVHLIKRRSEKKKREKEKHTQSTVSQPQEKGKTLLFVFCCHFHATSWITQARGSFQVYEQSKGHCSVLGHWLAVLTCSCCPCLLRSRDYSPSGRLTASGNSTKHSFNQCKQVHCNFLHNDPTHRVIFLSGKINDSVLRRLCQVQFMRMTKMHSLIKGKLLKLMYLNIAQVSFRTTSDLCLGDLFVTA